MFLSARDRHLVCRSLGPRRFLSVAGLVVWFACRCNHQSVDSPLEVPPPDGLTCADRELIAGLARRGVHKTSAQLGRLRDEGHISKPIQRASGRGPGRPSTHYPEGTEDRIVAITSIRESLGRRAPSQDIPMWLFLLGHEIDLPRVRESFNSDVEKLLEWQAKYIAGLEAAEQLGTYIFKNASRTYLGKVVSRNLGVRRMLYESAAGSAIHAAIDFVLGNEPNPEGLRILMQAFGFGDEKVQEEAIGLVKGLSVRHLSERLADLSDEEMIQGRDNVARLVEIGAREASPIIGKSWQNRAANMGSFTRVRAISGMIAVIELARAERTSGFVTDNLVRGLDASRNSDVDGPTASEASPMES